jgi:surfeit locus 1 family protein
MRFIDQSNTKGTSAPQRPAWLRWLVTILAPVAVAVMVGLGLWQLNRLAERRVVNAAIVARQDLPAIDLNREVPTEPSEAEHRRATVRGEFDPAGEVYWRNQENNGSPGMHVVTPLRLEGGQGAVLVDRGWLPLAGPSDVDASGYQPPVGVLEVSGWISVPPTRVTDLSPYDAVPGPGDQPLKAWFWLDPVLIERQLGYRLLPFVLMLEGSPATDPRALPRLPERPALDEGPHLGYAIQWFSFAAITVAGLFAYWRTTRRAAR